MILNNVPALIVSGALILGSLCPRANAAAQQGDVPAARRIAAMGAVALDEYAHGLPGAGRVKAEAMEELDEARAFLEEARHRAQELSPPLRALTLPVFAQLLDGVKQRRPLDELQAALDGLRLRLERVLRTPLDPLPAAAPSLVRGARVFRPHCVECHGKEGRGDGPKARRLDPRPANFTLRDSLRSASPLDFFRKISVGVAGTEMRDWEGLI